VVVLRYREGCRLWEKEGNAVRDHLVGRQGNNWDALGVTAHCNAGLNRGRMRGVEGPDAEYQISSASGLVVSVTVYPFLGDGR
jgi:hypothetical protein